MEVAVDTILDYRPINGKPHFLIKWVNLPHQYNSWESLDQLEPIIDQIQSYFATQSKHKLISNQPKRRKNTGLTLKRQEKLSEKQEWKMKADPINLDEDVNICESSHTKPSKLSRIAQKRKQGLKIQGNQQSNIDTDPEALKKHLKLEDKNTQQTQADYDQREQQSEDANFDIIGTIARQDIQSILSCFTWKEVQCVSIKLKNGNIANMQRVDFALVHPQMLIEFCETHNVIF